MDTTTNPIVIEVAIVLAISASLTISMGPLVSTLIEGIKPTGLIPVNYAGVAALLVSTVLGLAIGLMVGIESGWRYVAYGAIAGLLGPGCGAIRSAQVREGIEARKHRVDVKGIAIQKMKDGVVPQETAS